MMFDHGPHNSIADIKGLRVGHAQDAELKSGTTALVCDVDNVASVHVVGGAPGTRDTDLLAPENTVIGVDALILSGGSAFGLDACGGAQSALREMGRGFAVADQRVPIVPGAILFDLVNGGDKDWGTHSPYRDLGYQAVKNASDRVDIGSVGAGTGALVGGPEAGLKGGLGTASVKFEGITIAALVAANALGSPTVGTSPNFWAAPFEIGNEFGGLGMARESSAEASALRIKFRETQSQGANTTIGIIATDAQLTPGETKRLAVAAHDGFARALWPAHTPFDGDLIFGLSTGGSAIAPPAENQIELSALSSSTMARAIARGIHAATASPNDIFPTWQDRFNGMTAST
ncbi:MAG: P1 family peptidase [Ahrensia sp.]|nr:P1 family peptidase [Ahrensia sp.]